jgi:nitroreductase
LLIYPCDALERWTIPLEGSTMTESLLDLIRRRRTIRHFTDESVSNEEIDTLIELAMCAPTRLNRQPWHFVVVRDKAMQRAIAELLRIHPYIEQASVLIAVCGVPQASSTWLLDVSAATENLLLAATAIGLGAAWVGAPDTTLWNLLEEHLRDTLRIPLDVRIPVLVAVGHPAESPPPHGRHDRFDPRKVHYGVWGNVADELT